MKLLREWLARVGGLFNKRRRDRDFYQELQSHLQLHIDDHVRSGLAPAEAKRQAVLRLGGVDATTEAYRDQRGLPLFETLWQDLRYGARMLRKNPGFTAVAVLTLALGVGANTAIFSVIDAVLLRPLPFPESGRLVTLSERGPDWSGGSIAYPNFLDWKSQQSVFETFGLHTGNSYTLTGSGEPALVQAALVSADVFAALRAQPQIGRPFREDEDRSGAAPVVLLSAPLWQSRFGADSAIVNKTIQLSGQAYTVIGVMPAGFEFPFKSDVWVPLGPSTTNPAWQKRDYHPGLYGIARLKPGITLPQAQAEFDVIAARLAQQYPESNKTRGIQLEGLLDNRVGNVRRALWILFGAVSFVLIIACANVASLLLARAAAREKEIAVRAALGAGQWRIARQLLAESFLLTLLGLGLGLLIAKGALHALLALAGDSIARASEISIDPRVLLFSSLIAIVTGVLFGLAPAWGSRRINLQGVLKESGRGNTAGGAGLRQGLVVAEVALTFILLIGASLLLLSFHRLVQVNPGFRSENILSFRLNLPPAKYPGQEQQILHSQAVLEKMRALPGVASAAVASQIPLDNNSWDMLFLIEGRPVPPPHERPSLQVYLVTPDYFQTMGIPLLQGRDFTPQDNQDYLRGTLTGNDWGKAMNAVIIDEDFAKQYWPGASPLGQRIRLPWGEPENQPVMTVVGVVGRVKKNRLSEQGGMVQAYFPLYQQPLRGPTVVLKTSGDPAALIPSIRQQIAQLDPGQPVFGINTMQDLRDRNLASDKMNLSLLGAFALLALALAIVGLYGLLSFIVAQRQREIGVRMALGAKQSNVLGLIIGQGMRLILVGIVIGILGSLALTRVLATVLFQVTTTDPMAFLAVTATLSAVALLACYLPARRAAQVDPMIALRCE